MGTLIAILHKEGEDATQTAMTMLKALKTEKTETFGIASPTTAKTEKTIEALQNHRMDSNVLVGHAFSKILPSDKHQPILLENAALVLDGRIYSHDEKIPNTETIAEKLQDNIEERLKSIIEKTDAEIALAIARPQQLIAARDTMGTRPLYYGEKSQLAALASERKALWRIGIEEAKSFPPGHFAIAGNNGFTFTQLRALSYSKPKPITAQDAAKELQTLLEQSIRRRVLGLEKVAIAFSGGLDSSLIALLAEKSKTKVHLIHTSLENQPETEHAKKVAEELQLPIHISLHKEEDVEKALPKVLWLVEEADPIKTSIGIPIYWTAEEAAKMKLKVMLTGQGADELFGGYKRYVDNYLAHGSEKVRRRIYDDVARIHETNLERDFKICNFHDVELRSPFLTYEMARFALSLPIRFKIEPRQNGLRKLILRKAAENLGLPEPAVKKPKKAIQYATGIDKALKRLARKRKLSVREYLDNTFRGTTRKMM